MCAVRAASACRAGTAARGSEASFLSTLQRHSPKIRQQASVHGDRIARLDEDFDDWDVLEIADVGDCDIN
jgi:hypothetical protein